jgi:hypothetical protein
MKQYFSSPCIWSIHISVHTIFQSLFGSYKDFHDKGLQLTKKLLNQGYLVVNLKSSPESFMVVIMTWLTVAEYVCHRLPRICSVEYVCHR